ncbi:hypothetical protein Tco_1099211, partial [Tanacetum coccineum]
VWSGGGEKKQDKIVMLLYLTYVVIDGRFMLVFMGGSDLLKLNEDDGMLRAVNFARLYFFIAARSSIYAIDGFSVTFPEPVSYLIVITSAFFESYQLANLVDYTCRHLATSHIYYAKGTIDSMKSVFTQSALDALCEKYYIPDVAHPQLPEMDLFAFIHHADPTKVKIGEREVREGEVLLLELNQGRVVPLAGVNDQGGVAAQGVGDDNVKEGSDDAAATDHAEQSGPVRLREDHGTFGDVGVSTVRKSLAALQDLLDKSTIPARLVVTARLPQLRTKRPDERFVISLDIPHDSSANAADDEVSSVVRSIVPDPVVLTTTIATTVVAGTSVPLPRGGDEPAHASIFSDSTSVCTDVLNESALDESNTCRSLVNQLAPPMFFSQLRAMEYDQLFTEFNVGTARQTCLGAEVRMRLEHVLRGKKRLEGKCPEAAKAIRLRGQIANVEAAKAAQAGELECLKERNPSCDDLSIKASILECEKDKLVDQVFALEATCFELRDEVSTCKLFKEQIEAVQDVQVKVLSDRIAELDANLMGMALHLDEEFYPRYLTTIAEQSLAEVAAHNPAAEADYVDALNALHAVEFPLLAQLASYKDASISDLIDLLRLEGTAADIPKLSLLQPSPEQLMLPIHRLGDQANAASRQLSISDALVPLVGSLSAENLVGEASTSGVPVTAMTTALSTTFVQDSTIPLVSVVNHEASGAGPSTVVPPSSEIVFEKELETTPEHTMAS